VTGRPSPTPTGRVADPMRHGLTAVYSGLSALGPPSQPPPAHDYCIAFCTPVRYKSSMAYRDTALEALETARRSLRDIMAEAVAAEAFADVAMIARIAESLAAITTALRDGDGLAPPPEARGPVSAHARASVLSIATTEPARVEKTATTARRQNYPQYFREADRLVKRAWSKKERKPYEHKAPREIIDVLLEAIEKHRGHQRPFEAAVIMPLYRSNGEEYPSYQSYLALGWLRHAGAIVKAREGYLLRRGWDRQRIAQLWDALLSVA
jgi:hypothetical protein